MRNITKWNIIGLLAIGHKIHRLAQKILKVLIPND